MHRWDETHLEFFLEREQQVWVSDIHDICAIYYVTVNSSVMGRREEEMVRGQKTRVEYKREEGDIDSIGDACKSNGGESSLEELSRGTEI